ncbi:MAG: inner membrane CreD family protein, partial [Novosphingobium sp.]
MSSAERREKSPAIKLLLVGLIAFVLIVPLMMVYGLVWDRQNQAQTAQAAINEGWGGPQVISGPVIVVPFRTTQTQTEEVNGKSTSKVVEVEKLFYISPVSNAVSTKVDPEERKKSIYRSVLYTAHVTGAAKFALPADLERFGVTRERLMWDRAELRMGASDARGLTTGGVLKANGQPLSVQPGKGPAASRGQGFFAFLNWTGEGELAVDYTFGLRGARGISLVPRGGSTSWDVTSAWASPNFNGAFLPDKPQISDKGFTAKYQVDKLALGQPPVSMEDYGAPYIPDEIGADSAEVSMAKSERLAPVAADSSAGNMSAGGAQDVIGAPSLSVNVNLIEPVNLYSKVDRSVKYGFMFIGFTFV